MASRNVGRIIGFLLVLQIVGLIVPFAMLHPVSTRDYLQTAAAGAQQVRLATFLLLANCALGVGIATLAWPVFEKRSSALASLFIAVGAMMLTVQAVDNGHITGMVALSKQYAELGSDPSLQSLSTVVSATRRGVHFWELFLIDAWIGLFYGCLLRFRLVPVWLAAFGLLTVALHFFGITGPLLIGAAPVMALGATMALSHLATAGWLIAKGFAASD
jgi:hypothetical protein